MNTIVEKRQEVAKLARSYQEIATKKDPKDFTAEERSQLDKIWADLEAGKKDVAELERQDEARRLLTDDEKRAAASLPGAPGAGPQGEPKTKDFFRHLLAGEKVESRANEKRAGGWGIGASNTGGAFVPTQVYNLVYNYIRPFGWWGKDLSAPGVDFDPNAQNGANQPNKDFARVIHTDSGAPLNMPIANDLANSATIIGEGATIALDTSTPFSVAALNAYKFTSGQLAVSYELLYDSAIDVEMEVSYLLAQRFGRAFNSYFTVGTGISQPTGILASCGGFQSTITGKAGVPQFLDIIKLFYAVNAYHRNHPAAAFMANDQTLQGMMALVDNNNRPLMNFNSYGDQSLGNPSLFGKPVISNYDMPSSAVSAKSLIFGNLSTFAIRFVRDLLVIRQVEALATTGQIGFVGLLMADSKLLDTTAVQYFQGAAT
jgi:predicted phage gp36 major capsid-like protein